MSNLITTNIWDEISRAVKKKPSKCHVAVAYFGSGASRLLPLKRGSTLIVDMSERAVKCGQTKPSEILKLLKANVEVHSVENLHAKVFVVDSLAFVGSTNASQNSETDLIEAALTTTHRATVRQCRDFVRSLQGESITPAYAQRMQRFYKPPKFGGGHRRRSTVPQIPAHSRLWAVPLQPVVWDEREQKAADAGLPKAEKKLRSVRRFQTDMFSWEGSDLIGRLRQKDLVIQVTTANHRKMVTPAARVLHVEPYKNDRTRSGIVFVEVPKALRRKSEQAIIGMLGREGRFLGKLTAPCVMRDHAFNHSLLNLWSRHNG